MAEYYQLRKDASPILLTKFDFFSAYQKNSANGGKNPKLISFFNKTPPSRQANRTNLFLLFFLVTCLTGAPPGMMWGSPASPPPPPPPLPPASTTHPTPHSGWRRQQGSDYWERVFQSFGDSHHTATADTTAAASSPRFSISTTDGERAQNKKQLSRITKRQHQTHSPKHCTII